LKGRACPAASAAEGEDCNRSKSGVVQYAVNFEAKFVNYDPKKTA